MPLVDDQKTLSVGNVKAVAKPVGRPRKNEPKIINDNKIRDYFCIAAGMFCLLLAGYFGIMAKELRDEFKTAGFLFSAFIFFGLSDKLLATGKELFLMLKMLPSGQNSNQPNNPEQVSGQKKLETDSAPKSRGGFLRRGTRGRRNALNDSSQKLTESTEVIQKSEILPNPSA